MLYKSMDLIIKVLEMRIEVFRIMGTICHMYFEIINEKHVINVRTIYFRPIEL